MLSETHGGIDLRELEKLGISPEEVLDFSVNSNPCGPAPGVYEAIHSVDVSAYPDRQCMRLRDLLADLNHISPGNLLLGNGTTELIWLIAQAFLQVGDRVLIVEPTFGEYRRAVFRLGAEVIEVRAQPPDFHLDSGQLVEAVQKNAPRLVFLCNPNNPSGQYLPESAIRGLLSSIKGDTLLVLDEAYRAFAGAGFFSDFQPDSQLENCIMLRSMTKDFALAGLRLGYALASADTIARLRQFQPAWSVNAIAQAAGIAALHDLAYYRKTLEDLRVYQDQFFRDIRSAGFDIHDSSVHFGLIPCEGPAQELKDRLLHACILVRDCTSFGLPEHVRISTRLPLDNRKLVQELKKIKRERLFNR